MSFKEMKKAWKEKMPPELPVVMRTYIEEDAVYYEVRVSFDGRGRFPEGKDEATVWKKRVPFGKTDRNVAGGWDFREAAQDQQRFADAWVEFIKERK